ncbi:hypothetical protein C7H19_12720 [Aphanothece hegewaldii CCALA 016]|uniref:Uncharacterized protein n=1 Tax=Aphanothece hegewaldii CCALA 016 TaxID=2107694 RepID=A0A2T1LXI7_9CHRO|nr:hypothetical protein [Aphanothece hegewaldii]PSF36823.1 hypothetical protein C7H19_12720 [Aphanothece hegewaldii CCALA 016]
MTWIFSLSAECGSVSLDAEKFSQYFDQISFVLSNGTRSQCYANIFQDLEENWWCRVCCEQISEIGINTPETAYLMTELGILLYQHLQSAPDFRYALVGVEVDEFRTYSELIEDSSILSFPGLVLAETIWNEMNKPSAFRTFSLGYVWKPYEGEVYKPLLVSSVLKNKLNELLVMK